MTVSLKAVSIKAAIPLIAISGVREAPITILKPFSLSESLISNAPANLGAPLFMCLKYSFSKNGVGYL
jgi:hypothetical protein